MRSRGAQGHRERAVRLERRRKHVLREGEGRIAPHVVRIELRAVDPERAERHGELAQLILPIDERDGPPPRRSLDDPVGGRWVAAHAPDPTGAGPVVDADREDVFTAPVERVHRDAIATVCLPLAPVIGGEGTGLPELHPIQERLVDVVDLPELQVHRPPSGVGREGKARPVPRVAVVVRMPGFLPGLRYRHGLPRVLVELTRRVPGIIARAEPPRPGDRVHVVSRDDRRSHLARERGGASRVTGDRGGRDRALQQRQTVGRELGEVVREDGHTPADRHDRGPHLRFGRGEGRPHQETIGIVQPGRPVIEAAKPGGTGRCLDATPARVDIRADAHPVHVADGVLQRGATPQ